jgi:hypothetical protein
MTRRLTEREKDLVRALILRAPALHVDEAWLEQVLVTPMDDGGMGSLTFCWPDEGGRLEAAAELQFLDADQVPVSASLNVDGDARIRELDIWKVDFSPLENIPSDLS